MSRIINYSSAVTLTPTGYTTAGSYTFTHQTVANAYTNADSTTSNRMTLSGSRYNTRQSEMYYNFDTSLISQIPSDATITSVAANVKYYVNNTTYVTDVSIRLYANTTAKGSAVTNRPTSATKYSITTGSWTRSELQNARLYVSATHNASNSSGYLYFYGADLTVNYTVNGVEYEVAATSEYNGASVSPSSQFILQGEDAIVRIDTDTLDNMVLEDNGTDVTENLQYVIPQGDDTISRTPTTFSTGGSQTNTTFYRGSSQYTGTSWLEQAIGHSAENPSTENTTGNTYVKSSQSTNYTSGWMIYNFDFSEIPEDAIIDSTEVRFYGAREEAGTDVQHRCRVELYSGNSSKANYYELTNTSNALITLPAENTGTWTRAELQQAKFRFSIAYYGGRLMGITWEVNYHTPTSPYYQYTLSNIAADHDIVFKESVIVPPEEDPQKTYYSLTISSINATTEPGRGTTRVESGSTETIKIYPSDPQLTLTTDNGTNISSQLVYHAGSQPTYEVSTAQGASYGFSLNNGTGYYVSQNTDVDKSAAVSKIDFDLPVSCLVTFQFINYAEATYDFGVFGNIDTALSNDYYAAGSNGATITDGSYKLACNTSTYNTSSVQTLTYEIPAGQHYIYVKYSKDDASADNNDSLQWKISNIEPLSPVSDAYYEYTLSNINQNHSLIFIFGDVTYYFVTSTHDGNGKLYPDGQTVCLPGDTYKLTIVPETTEDTVTVSDNNTDVTNSLERKEVVIEKNGQSALTVNYIYTIANVQTAHTISVHDSSVVRYTINASSTYAGATVSPSSQRVEEGDDAVVSIAVNNAYEIRVKDNGTDVTSSLVEGDNRCTYTISNVQSAHTIVVEEAPYYNVSTSSSYAGVTATASPSKVYAGRTCTVTIAGANKDTMIVKDNGTNVTSSLVGSNNSYTYTLSNVSTSHTITVEAITYSVTASSTYGSATITPASSTVIRGNSLTLTINAVNKYEIKVLDNGTDVTSSVTGSSRNYKYTLTNIQGDHTITVQENTYYTITISNTFTSATASTSIAKVYVGQTANAVITVNVPYTYQIVFKDNNVDKTSSLTGSNGTFTYTISNVNSNHAISIVEATYYTITTANTYNGASISAPSKVYVGQNATATITVANSYEIVFKDNNVDKTSSLVAGSNETYTYTITNMSGNHTLSIVEADYYAVTVNTTYGGATASASPTKVYKGQGSTVTIDVPNKYEIKVFDNGTNVTSSVTGSSRNYKYNLTNVQADHTITVQENDYYTISTSSSYSNATVSTNISKVYVGQTANATITVRVSNKYEIIFKDNGTDKTSNLSGSNGVFTYTISNVAANHSLTVTEASYYTITTSSNYGGATVSASPSKIYVGQSSKSSVITLNVANIYEVVVKDNGTTITGRFSGSNGAFTYTLTNISANHSIVVTENTYYNITVSSTYSSAGISANPTKVYVGRNSVITVTGNTSSIKIMDNGVDVTEMYAKDGSNLVYVLGYVQTSHTITVSFVQTPFVKTGSSYTSGKKCYKKTGNSTWTEMTLSELQTYIQNNSMFYETTQDRFNGHPYVDLGLPSGTLWATCNVGANSPEEFGGYFAWGETSPKSEHQSYNYALGFWDSDYPDCNMIKYNSSDGLTALLPENDAASANMGGEWRMPTVAQLRELSSNTTLSQYTINGINGCLLTSRNNGRTIFFPYMGWSQNGEINHVGETLAINSRDIAFPGWTYCGFTNSSATSFQVDDEDPSCTFIGRPVRGVIG